MRTAISVLVIIILGFLAYWLYTSYVSDPLATEPQTMEVLAYFGTESAPQGEECTSVEDVVRTIPETTMPVHAALTELLEGPTEREQEEGLYSSINRGVTVNDISISGGTAQVDFSEELSEGVAGACLVTHIRTQIEETLRQFDSVETVIISVNGSTEGVLEP